MVGLSDALMQLGISFMKPLLKVSDLSKEFVKSLDLVAKFLNKIGQDYREEIVHAVDNVSFEVFKGEVVGVVGESGCGKSTLGRMVSGILDPTQGKVEYDENQFNNKKIPLELRTQMIFQDPFSSLNPRKRVIDIISEAPLFHQLISLRKNEPLQLKCSVVLVWIKRH